MTNVTSKNLNCNINLILLDMKNHTGLFKVNNNYYDDMLYCNNDNVYFSYCFNYTIGKAIREELIIIETIEHATEDSFIINKGTSTESIIILEKL